MNKKRTFDEQSPQAADAGAPSSHRGRPSSASAHRTPLSSYSWYNPTFREECKARSNALGRSATLEYRQQVAAYDIPTSDEEAERRGAAYYIDDAGEYLRRLAMHQYFYGGVAGDVVSFGNDDSYQLGQVAFLDKARETIYTPNILSALRPQQVRQVAAGGLHSVAVTADGDVYSWGNSDDGCLGRDAVDGPEDEDGLMECTPMLVTGFVTRDGKNRNRSMVAVSAGDAHTLYLSMEGEVFTTGMMKDMDSGKFANVKSPNDSPQGFRDRPVHVPLQQKAIRIVAGYSINAALLEDETLVTWGMGHKGELARSEAMTQPDADGNFELGKTFCYEPETDDEGNIFLAPKEDVIRDMFLLPKAPLWDNALPTLKKIVVGVAAGGFHLLVAARDPGQAESKLYSSGLNNYGQLGHGDVNGKDVVTDRHKLTLVKALEKSNIVKVAAGEHFSLGMELSGRVLYAFGRSDYGQLGIDTRKPGEPDMPKGSFETVPQVVQFPGVERTILSDIACGDRHAIAVTVQNELYTWGFNETGTTGHKTLDAEDVYVPTKLNISHHLKQNALPYQIAGGGQHTLLVAKRYA